MTEQSQSSYAKPPKGKMRLDDYLVQTGSFDSKEDALRAVLAHEVKVDDVYVTSAAIFIKADSIVEIKYRKSFVSRGGHKLQGALDAFKQDVTGLHCIDVGASTGGFTDCLLQSGAGHIACVDVNYGQLAWTIRTHPRVTVFERTNIKTATPAELGAPFDVIVCDVSFIGLAGLIPTFTQLCHPKEDDSSSIFIGLVKPQFESKHDETDHGVVTSEEVRLRTVEEVKAALAENGFNVTGIIESPIRGPEGNVEYLVRAEY